jgi:hypothetical protein
MDDVDRERPEPDAHSVAITELVTKRAIRLAPIVNRERIPRYEMPPGVSPLDVLLCQRAEDDR